MLHTPPPFRFHRLSLLVSLSLTTVLGAHAQSAPPSTGATLKEVVISGSRNEQFQDDLPLSVDLITARDLEEGQMGDIRDVAKSLPNVSVKRAPARFGVTGRGNSVGADANAGFSIRGQGGNRVVMLVDCVRLPRSYVNGSNAFGRDSVSVGLLKRIEVLHGPTSVLYGSDGLAGLVNFITLEPADFLRQSDGTPKSLGGKAWISYSGDDQGTTLGGTVAARASETAEWSLTGTKTRSSGMGNMGSNDAANVDRTTPNPQTQTGDSLLGKLVLRLGSGQRHALTLEHVRKDSAVDLLSSRVKTPVAMPLTTTTSTATTAAAKAILSEDSVKSMDRNRLSWDASYQVSTAMADHLQTTLSWQDSAAQDNGKTVLQTLFANDGTRVRKTSYNERSWQANVQADKTLKMSPQWSQKLTYGVDYASTTVSGFADGSDPAPLAVFVPRKYFPDTRDSSQAVYLQSEWISDSWSITPGVRFDQFALDVLSQDGYFPGIANAPGKSLSGSAVSPKLGILFRATPQWSVYGNYASGFRAPEGQQVNSALEVSTAKLLPNPDLKPEESRNMELGARLRSEPLELDIALFSSQYTNLIYEKYNFGPAVGTVLNPTVFQTINIDKARISGLEIKGRWNWGSALGGKLSTPFSYGQASGTNDTNGQPLNTIDPAKLTIGLKYETSRWDMRLDVIQRDEKKVGDIDSAYQAKSQFTPSSIATLDLSGQWRLRKDVRLNFAINNLTDRKYWNWSDVQGLASNASPQVVDAYTQPGRHINLSLVAEF